MGIKRKLIALSLGSILVLIGSVGSFAYLKSQDNIKSKVQTGTFPRCKVKIYASIGPLYNNCIWGKNNKESEFYKPWLNNANKYIKEDIIGKRNDIIGSGKAKFQNIENNNKNPITAKAIVGTWMTNEHSWMGDKDGCGNENGSMIHYLVAISNGANEGVQRRKLDFEKSGININQKDIFKTNKMGKEYSVYRKRCLNTSKIDLKDQDKRRIRTYNWNGKEYIENGSYGDPSHSADLIVFDVGNNVYYSMDGSKKGLQKTYNMLTGKEDMYAINKKWQWDKFKYKHYALSNWSDKSSMYDISLQMYLGNKGLKDMDSKGRLRKSECSINYTYNNINGDSSKDTYVINIGD